MQDHPVLAHVALGYSPMIDRQRAVVATRLTVFPAQADSAIDAAALLRALEDVWPASAAATNSEAQASSAPLRLAPRPLDPAAVARAARTQAQPQTQPPLSLNLAGESLLRQVMHAGPGAQMMVEVPAFMAAEAAASGVLASLHAAGSVLVIKGRPTTPLAPEVLALFSQAIVDGDEGGEQRGGDAPAAPAGAAHLDTVQAGARSNAAVDAAFKRGAVAVLGWPWDDEPPVMASRSAVPSDVKTVMELISAVDREEPVPKLEAVLRRDPTLAFRLLRYLNSPAFGMSVEINSFGHALMLLGYQRLKRWLALLLASSSKGANAKPLLFAAVRRGLLMEELGRAQGAAADNSEMRGEMFICGVFSLLDRLLQQRMDDLLAAVPVPDRVQNTLRGSGGPFLPYLDLVRAIEQESLFDIRQQSEALMLSPMTVNRALLGALHAAHQLDG